MEGKMDGRGTRMTAQFVKCLQFQHVALGLGPKNPQDNLGVVVCTCNPSSGEEGTGGFLELTSQTI